MTEDSLPCSSCGLSFGQSALLPLEGKLICSNCKPKAVQRLSEGLPQKEINPDMSIDLRGLHDFKKFSVILLIVLNTITFGFYGIYWLWRTEDKLTKELPRLTSYKGHIIVLLIFAIISFFSDFADMAEIAIPDVFYIGLSFMALANLIVSLWVIYGMRSKFHVYHGIKPGSTFWINAVILFFFNLYYLQYKINRAHEIPPSSRGRKKPNRDRLTPEQRKFQERLQKRKKKRPEDE